MKEQTGYLFAGLALLLSSFLYGAGETITITSPSNGSTVSAVSLLIQGMTSQTSAVVSLFIDDIKIVQVLSIAGNWSYTYPNLGNGSHIITAKIFDERFTTLVSNSVAFTVVNPPTITITAPENDQIVGAQLPNTISGVSSLPTTTVQLSIDGVVATSVLTDAQGNWAAAYPFLMNGEHELLAELITGNPLATVASDEKVFTVANSFLNISGSALLIMNGVVPTTGSGNGVGYAYSNAGTTMTMVFDDALPSLPTVLATGQQAVGGSSVCLSFVSTTSASFVFSAGTEYVHFELLSSLT